MSMGTRMPGWITIPLLFHEPIRSISSDNGPDILRPLCSIGLVVALMLIVPMVYSMAPTGPIREGDTIFSDGQHKVLLTDPRLYDHTKYEGTCLLDPQDPSTVLQRPFVRADGSLLAQVTYTFYAVWWDSSTKA